jgi:hypothetical protein
MAAAREPQAVDQEARDSIIQDLVLDLRDQLHEIAFCTLACDSLEDLFNEMVNLDFEFAQQKPRYVFHPELEKFTEIWDAPFSPSSMKTSTDESTKIIPGTRQPLKLVLRPGLFKYGNSARKQYSRGTSILNITVEVMAVGQPRHGRSVRKESNKSADRSRLNHCL